MTLRDAIAGRNWRFHHKDGGTVHWLIQLAANGAVINYDHPNERGWAIQDGHLVFLNAAAEATSRFDSFTERDGRLFLAGPHLLGPRRFDVALTSWLAYDPNLADAASCHIHADLNRDSDIMVVTLNGMGNPCSGDTRRTRFEMPGFASALGANRIQIAEREERCAWYADKLSFLTTAIAPLCQATRRIILIGTSAGGYGAALLAESLADALPARVASIMVNPQTTLLASHRDRMLATIPARYLPPTISDAARAGCDPRHLHLPDAIGCGRAVHHLLFDSANPAETYYAALLESLPSCRLTGIPLGRDHVTGVREIYSAGTPRRLAEAWLEGS